MTKPINETYKNSTDLSAALANAGMQWVDIYHIPTGYSVNFKAMLTAFSDAYTSDWGSEATFGRMDPIQTFQRTTRKMSIAYDVVAGSLEEAIDNLDRISILIQFLYPSYENRLIKNSPFCKLQFLNWATDVAASTMASAKDSGLLGTVEGFTFAPDLEAGVFVGGDNKIYPKILNVSLGFTVIHQNDLGWEYDSFSSGFPYLGDSSGQLGLSGDAGRQFPAPVAKEQTDEVEQFRKEQATANEISGNNARVKLGRRNDIKRRAQGKTAMQKWRERTPGVSHDAK